MQHWKVLILGITGDLALLKVLPALSQFAEKNKAKIRLSLIGYSRSKPDVKKIESILNKNCSSGQHNLVDVSFFQGQYTNQTFFDSLYQSIDDENEKLLIYLAVPPNTFLDFLNTSCPYGNKNIDIIMEKPFGRSLKEAKEIIDKLQECKLQQRVHFFDHYLFKSSVYLNKAELNNIQTLKKYNIHQIDVRLLESIGIKDRAGYYDQTGALKDMLPHAFTLLTRVLNNFLPQYNLDIYENFKISSVILAQYKNYPEDIRLESSNTDTYFCVEATLGQIKLKIESGKRLDQKLTDIEIIFENGKINWNIAPKQTLSSTIPENLFEVSITKDYLMDHARMFENILNKDYSLFVKPGEVLISWWIFDLINKKIRSEKKDLSIYQSGAYPLKVLSTKNISNTDTNKETDLQKAKDNFLESFQELVSKSAIKDSPQNPSKKGRIQL
jgi:glucose-6-phosphate 1-dehydrogenase